MAEPTSNDARQSLEDKSDLDPSSDSPKEENETEEATPLKPTTNVGQGWITLLMVIGAVALFVYVMLPKLPRAESPLIGSESPDFVLPVIHGGDADNRIRLSELRGKVVVLDFWASWCTPCHEQAQILNELARQRSDSVFILGIATGEPLDASRNHASKEALTYPSVHDTGSEVAIQFGAIDLPTVVVLDKTGTVIAIKQGILTLPELDQLIQQADET